MSVASARAALHISACTIAVVLAVSVPQARAIINFGAQQHGEVITTQFLATEGLIVSADNPNRPFDLAIIFDCNRTGTADPDLEGPPWSGGNLPSNTNFGNTLILAENNIDTQVPIGFIDSPDDEGNRPAGDLIFQYNRVIDRFGFDIIDVEGVMDENGRISFFRNNVLLGEVNFSEFVTPGSDVYDPTISFGDHSANRIQPITVSQLNGVGFDGFDKIVVRLGGSGAIDNLVVPEPSMLAGITLAGAMLLRRRLSV